MPNITLDNAVDRFRATPTPRTARTLRRVVGEYLRDGMVDVATHAAWHDATRDYVVAGRGEV